MLYIILSLKRKTELGLGLEESHHLLGMPPANTASPEDALSRMLEDRGQRSQSARIARAMRRPGAPSLGCFKVRVSDEWRVKDRMAHVAVTRNPPRLGV